MLKRPLALLFVIGALSTGCSDADPTYLMVPKPLPPMASPPPPPVPPVDVAGTWYSRAEKNAVNCGAGETVDAQAIVISQVDGDVEMLTSTGDYFVGTVNGDLLEWTGSYLEDGGTSSLTSATLVFSLDSGAGNAAWTWSDGTDSCNGTMAIDAARNVALEESGSNSWPEIADPFDFVDNVAFFAGSLSAVQDQSDYFTFTLAADGVVQAELSHFDTQATDLDLVLLDEDLNEVAVSRNSDQFELVSAQLQAGIKYYLGVESQSISGDEVYNLSIDLN